MAVGIAQSYRRRTPHLSQPSTLANVLPLLQLWKSEVLLLCRHQQVPQSVINQSCNSDCACGRAELAALHIPEVDLMLMQRVGQLDPTYIERVIPESLRAKLSSYIDEQLA